MLLALTAGLISGLALVAGAAVAWFARIPRKVVGAIMALGAGVLISALAFDLVEEADATGGLVPTLAGFVLGALVYLGADLLLERAGSRHHRKGGDAATSGTGLGIALGALLDGIPETAVQGVQVAATGLPVAVLVAVVVSNVPEGLASTADLKSSGRSARYVFGLWGVTTLVCAGSAALGFAVLGSAPPEVSAGVTAFAAGAILAMLCNTMLPEAFRQVRAWTGALTVVGFLAGYVVHSLAG